MEMLLLVSLKVCLIAMNSFTVITFISTHSTQDIKAKVLACKQNKGVADKGPLTI